MKNRAEKDRVEAILEYIYSDYRAFGESLEGFREETNRRFDHLQREIEGIDKRLIRIEAIVFDMEKQLGKVEGDVAEMKAEIKSIRTERSGTIDGSKYHELKHRVEMLEAKVGVK